MAIPIRDPQLCDALDRLSAYVHDLETSHTSLLEALTQIAGMELRPSRRGTQRSPLFLSHDVESMQMIARAAIAKAEALDPAYRKE